MNGILSMPATGAIIQSVSQTKGAIGYVGLAYLNKEVKPIHVSYDAGNPTWSLRWRTQGIRPIRLSVRCSTTMRRRMPQRCDRSSIM